jgi:hypothetical protein
MSTFSRVAELPIAVEGYELRPLSFKASAEFERLSTEIVIFGPGADGERLEGWGEDITYEGLDQLALQDAGPYLDLAGNRTFGEFCELIGSLDLFPTPPEREVSRLYRRWAFESAALDLALRQSGINLPEALGRDVRPLNFVASTGLSGTPGSGGAPSIDPVANRLARYPDLRFKLDPTPDWSDELIEELAATGAIDILDLKGQYKGTIVDVETDPALYRKLAETFPEALLEDPDLTDETREVLAPHMDRVTWDAPIHSVADIEALEVNPKTINIKPSRLGGVESLFDAYDYCESNGIAMYGGGQWELGQGRGQIQYLAAIFHPDTPNDTAPTGYNDPSVPADLPASPLTPSIDPLGFRWI